MRTSNTVRYCVLSFFMLCVGGRVALSQGVTNAAMSGRVTSKGEPLPGVNVIAVHEQSGTKYGTSTRVDGRFNLPNMRVGGPYMVTASIVGYKKEFREQLFLQLSQNLDVNFSLAEEGIETGEVVVTAERGALLSPDRTGAATSVSRMALQALPTVAGRIDDFTRLTPQAAGSSFAGQDNKMNNVTVDGSYFNNSFGLQGQPGDRTGVAPISLDAIEQVQVNIAPFDVRQGNFVGASVNTVTKSGTNEISGSAYYSFRHQGLVGTKAKDLAYNPGTFRYKKIGVRLGGPIIGDKLFLFASFEDDKLTQPGTTFLANTGGAPVGGNTTRVLASDLDRLSQFLKDTLKYETGSYQGYDFETPATRFIAKLDYSLNDRNKLSLRYNHLDSESDQLVSNSSSLGFGGRRSSTNSLNFRNSNYGIGENIRSIIGEWSSIIGDNMANNLIIGYSHHDESRTYRGSFFPLVDILQTGSVYTTFGFEPFTPNNELRYSSFQLQNNFTMYKDDHNLTLGASAERYESENVFFPGAQSVYIYNSLEAFYRDARGYVANPNRTTTNGRDSAARFQVRWSNIPGQEKPIQPLEVIYAGVYAQDEWQVAEDVRLTLGLRLDAPFFSRTGYKNSLADALTFRDENGSTVQYVTDKLPNANVLFSPRVGFNWDVMGDRSTQVRGGSGVFTGRPAYVWISNQIGNTGVLTGFEDRTTTGARPFHPDPDHYKPTNVTGAPASSYELALTDPNFKFPQVWRSNIAVDQKLPFGLVGTAEFLFNRDVNGIYYINANLSTPNTKFSGVDNRPRWTTSNRINSNVANATVLKNQNAGYSWNIATSLERPWTDGLYAKAAYSYAVSKNTVDPGSIAFGSWSGNQHSGNPNNPGVAFSANSPGSRIFATVSYRAEYFDFGATTVSLFWEGIRNTIFGFGNFSYTLSGDLNGDGVSNNDLIYIPRDASQMNFEQYTPTVSGTPVTFTVQQQIDAWNTYIESDKYLSKNRGNFAERGGAVLPMVYRADLSVSQDVFTSFLEKRNTLQFRIDLLNVGNLLNKNWGVGQRFANTSNANVQPLIARGASANGAALYRLRNVGTALLTNPLEQTTDISDVFRIQLGVRYIFN